MKYFLLLIAFVCGLLPVHGQDGSLDPSFAAKGWTTTGFDKGNFLDEFGRQILMQNDGSLLVVISVNAETRLARYLASGILDTQFGSEGFTGPAPVIPHAAIQAGDKIVVAGEHYNPTTASYSFALTRFNRDGSLDLSFGNNGLQASAYPGSGSANAVALQDNGKIVAAGYVFDTLTGDLHFALAQYLPDGTLDKAFGSGGFQTDATGNPGIVNGIAIQRNGKIVLGGWKYDPVTRNRKFTLARYSSNGKADKSFGNNGQVILGLGFESAASAVAIQKDDKILAAGWTELPSENITDFALVRLTDNGSPDPSFDHNGIRTTNFGHDDFAEAIILQEDEKILLAGYSLDDDEENPTGDIALARFLTNGSPDRSFNIDGKKTIDFGGNETAFAAALQKDGKIVTAGHYFQDFHADIALTRVTDNGYLDNSFDGDGRLISYFPAPGPAAFNSLAVQSNGKVVAAGWALNPKTNDNMIALARLNANGTPDSTFAGDGKKSTDVGGQGSANSVTIQQDGKIVVAGWVFKYSTLDYHPFVARYLANGSLDNTFGAQGLVVASLGTYATFQSVALQDDGKIVLAGTMTNGITGKNNFLLARYNTDGSPDNGFDGDGIQTADFGGNATGYAVLLQPDGKIVVAGEATDAQTGNTTFALARFNSNGSPDISFDSDGRQTTDFGFGASGHALALQSDGKIVVAGEAATSEGYSDDAVARYNSNGSPDNSFGSNGIQTANFRDFDFVTSLTLQNDGKNFVGRQYPLH